MSNTSDLISTMQLFLDHLHHCAGIVLNDCHVCVDFLLKLNQLTEDFLNDSN